MRDPCLLFTVVLFTFQLQRQQTSVSGEKLLFMFPPTRQKVNSLRHGILGGVWITNGAQIHTHTHVHTQTHTHIHTDTHTR